MDHEVPKRQTLELRRDRGSQNGVTWHCQYLGPNPKRVTNSYTKSGIRLKSGTTKGGNVPAFRGSGSRVNPMAMGDRLVDEVATPNLCSMR